MMVKSTNISNMTAKSALFSLEYYSSSMTQMAAAIEDKCNLADSASKLSNFLFHIFYLPEPRDSGFQKRDIVKKIISQRIYEI